ncbi:MAG: type II toxin-antitoxin system YoeB family toxin [Puniceicoccales bacterium]|nr:type II toxin-antitoxin system YoeB family toxin [Puniceicoccales bacterium]
MLTSKNGKDNNGLQIFIVSGVDIIEPQTSYTIANEDDTRAQIEQAYAREEAHKAKALELLEKLKQHGTQRKSWTIGNDLEQLRGNHEGIWTLRINDTDRLAFTIKNNEITIFHVKGHYPPEKK